MIFLVSKVLDADIFEHRTYARIISGMKDEIISFSLLIENVGKELGERAVRSHGLKKGRLKSGRTNDDVKGGTVIKDADTVYGIRRNDADIPGT